MINKNWSTILWHFFSFAGIRYSVARERSVYDLFTFMLFYKMDSYHEIVESTWRNDLLSPVQIIPWLLDLITSRLIKHLIAWLVSNFFVPLSQLRVSLLKEWLLHKRCIYLHVHNAANIDNGWVTDMYVIKLRWNVTLHTVQLYLMKYKKFYGNNARFSMFNLLM